MIKKERSKHNRKGRERRLYVSLVLPGGLAGACGADVAKLVALVAHAAAAVLGVVSGRGKARLLWQRQGAVSGYFPPSLVGGQVLAREVNVVGPRDLRPKAFKGVGVLELSEDPEAFEAVGAVVGHGIVKALLALSLVEE
jgi:hypothetical protein